jgi:hypothetical protein
MCLSDPYLWSRLQQMYQDVLLFLPPTQIGAERMGIDFALPISQVLP